MSNTADKRSPHTDALETLGTIIQPGEARDAIHLAVEPVVAGERLFAGQDVGLVDGKAYAVGHDAPLKYLGIVDPFLKTRVEEGQMFWLVVYPRQIRSLRHVWEHPDFPSETDKPAPKAKAKREKNSVAVVADAPVFVMPTDPGTVAKQWLEDYAQSLGGFSLDDLIQNTERFLRWGDYWVEGGRFEGESLPVEFWDHYETYTGMPVEESNKHSFFSCSC